MANKKKVKKALKKADKKQAKKKSMRRRKTMVETATVTHNTPTNESPLVSTEPLEIDEDDNDYGESSYDAGYGDDDY